MSSYYGDRHPDKPPNAVARVLKNPIVGLFRNLSLVVTGGIVVTGVFLGVGAWRAGDRFMSSLTSMLTAPQPQAKADVRSIVVQQVRGASELTTAVFAMQAVVPASRDRTVGGYVIGKTTLLYIAYGEVRAGVDLAELEPSDVQVVGDTIRLQLPPPQILDSKIDVTRSSVYDYDRGFLGLGPDAAPELQSLAQRETLRQVVDAACSSGVLQQASDRAETVVTQLLTTAGYKDFVVETQPASADACAIREPEPPVVSPSIQPAG